MQGQRAITEIQKQSVSPPGPETTQQIDNIQLQVNQKKSEFLEQKNQLLQQMQQVQTVELEKEVVQGQLESFFRVEKGENLIKKLNVELVIRDGVIEAIRGEI